VRKGWETEKLGDVCQIIKRGVSPKYLEVGGICVINQKCVRDHVVSYENARRHNDKEKPVNAERFIKVGDVLVNSTGTGTLGRVAQIRDEPAEPTTVDTHVTIVRPKPGKFYEDFFGYMLIKIEDEITESGEGASGQTELARTTLQNKFDVSYPKAISEQKRIVAILDEAFAGIDQAIANTEKNLASARELFEELLKRAFEAKGKHWEYKKWSELCHFVRGPFGGSLTKSIFKDQGYAVYEQKHAIHDHFNQLRYFIDEDKFNEMKRFEVKPGDIIMSCSGVTLGKVAVIPHGIPKGIINQALLKLTPNKTVSVHFLKHWLRSKIFQDIIFKYSGGAAIPNVPSAKILKEILIPLPSLKEQEKIITDIEASLNDTDRLNEVYNRKLAALNELKQSLLQKAFSGELTADVENQAEDAA
jgi:type I restriction enzyme, S subunit